MSSTGMLGVVPVYRRGAALIEEVWDGFMKERQVTSKKVGIISPGKSQARRLAFNYSSVSITNGRFSGRRMSEGRKKLGMQLRLAAQVTS